METDVSIVGGGMAGVLAAYELSRRGFKVALFEKDAIGGGATRYTTAFLTESIDTDFSDLIKDLGAGRARTVIEAHRDAISFVETIATEESIDCDFRRCSNYIFATKEKDLEVLRKETEAAKTLGVEASLKHDDSLGFKNFGYMEIGNQAKFHPLKFLSGVLEAAEKSDAKLFGNTEVTDIALSEDNQGVTIETNQGTVRSRFAFVATYEPFDKPLSLYFKKGFYTSYVFELAIPKGVFLEATYEDTENPYHYFRIDPDGAVDRMILGGEDHRSQVLIDPEKNFSALESYIKEIASHLEYSILRKWSGPILEPIDGRAYIGRRSPDDRILYAFGFSGNGMTYSAISARMIADIIERGGSPLEDVYGAGRLPDAASLLTKAKDYTEELFKGAGKNMFEDTEKE
jgi:glycine/D-amino acid oxidase-like deaminating enzyme